MIKHNSYFDGNVQSLGQVDSPDEEPRWTVGNVQPGEWDFGIAKRTELIQVIIGALLINGKEVAANITITINKGKPIRVTATSAVAYTCRYLD